MRRLPGPAVCRLSEGDNYSGGSLRIVSGLAVNPNSIFCDGSLGARGSQWMSGSAKSRNHPPRGTSAHDDTCHHALRVLANAPGTPMLTLDS